MASSPKGLVIEGTGSDKTSWKISTEIGSGSCASVYSLLDASGRKTDYVAKIVPLPVKTTKKKNSPAENNARLLDYEGRVYQCLFPDFQGSVIPSLPPAYSGKPVCGEIGKFQYLVMERMEKGLWDMVPDLLKSNQSKVLVGPIATRLVDCVQAFHEHNHLVVDVKPENFMLSFNESKLKASSKKTSRVEKMAAQIRLLDLAMIARLQGPTGGHKADEGIKELVGTPMYASLNVHDKHTPSRRDDIEALGYIIAELIIRLVAQHKNDTKKYESKNGIPSFLPWSQEKSDEAIGNMKREQTSDPNSVFYQRLGNGTVTKVIYKFFQEVQAYRYKETPNYQGLKDLLSELTISTDKITTKREQKITVDGQFRKRSGLRSQGKSYDLDDNDSPIKSRRTDTVIDDNEEFLDAAESAVEVVEMDWELEDEGFQDAVESLPQDIKSLAKENFKPIPVEKDRVGLKIVITDGPHQGDQILLLQGASDSVLLGSAPTSTRGETIFALSRDASLDATHARLDLKVSRQLCSVSIVDLKSTSGTLVRSEVVPRGKDLRAFINDTFSIGASKMKIQKLSPEDKAAVSHRVIKKDNLEKVLSNQRLKTTVAAQTTTSVQTGLGLTIQVISGPHKGDRFAMGKGHVETVIIGSNPSIARKGAKWVLSDEDALETKHARLELIATKKSKKVKVIDESDGGTYVNGKLVGKGKDFMAFMNDKIKIGTTEMLVTT